MTTNVPSLAVQTTYGSHGRFVPRTELRTYRIKPGTAVTYAVGTPFIRDEAAPNLGEMSVFQDAAEIFAFLWPREATRHATEEVMATFMIDGHLHRDDVPILNADGGAIAGITQAGLDTALASTELRKLGFIVDGLATSP